jgi:Tol biopolymer transport system component/DNA-binding winged helix-turn-helix (wHTH) protein
VRYWCFGAFVLDSLRGVLLRGGETVPLTPRVFQLLSVLVEQHGRVLGKDELLHLVWHDAIVEENNLPRSISTLRKALGERPGQCDYIATIPSVGYRFVSEVHATDEMPAFARSASGAPASDARVDSPPSAVRASSDLNVSQSHALAAPPSVVSAPVLDDEPIDTPAPAVASHAVPAVTEAMPRRRDRRPVSIAWLLPVSVLLILAAGVSAWRGLPSWRVSTRPRTLWQFTTGAGVQQQAAWSPDGSAVAYASNRDGNSDIWVQPLAGGEPIRVTDSPDYDGQPAWSPDSQWIVFRSEHAGGGLFIVSAHGGEPRCLAPFGFHPQWSPAGNLILFSASAPDTSAALRLFLIDAAGGTPRPLHIDADVQPLSAAWYPDGRRLSIFGGMDRGEPVFLTMPIGDGPVVRSLVLPNVQRQIADAGLMLSHFTWGRGGRFLYFDGTSSDVRNLWRIDVDPTSLAWTRGPERLTTGAGADSEIAMSPDGSRLVFSVYSGRPAMWSFAFDSTHGRIVDAGQPVRADAIIGRGADLETDGQRVVYRAVRGSRQELWEHSSAGDRLLGSNTWVSAPRLSPEGGRVVYARASAASLSDRAVAILAVANPREQLLTTPGAASFMPTDWSSDGAWILGACSLAPKTVGVCLLPVAGAPHAEREMHVVSSRERFALFQQRFSPDGHWVSFIAVPSEDRSTSTIYLVPRGGGPWLPVTDGRAYDDKPRWSPDGRTLYFISNRDGHFNVWGRHVDSATGQTVGGVFRVSAFSRSDLRLAPDLREMDMLVSSRRLLLPMYESSSHLWMLDQADR